MIRLHWRTSHGNRPSALAKLASHSGGYVLMHDGHSRSCHMCTNSLRATTRVFVKGMKAIGFAADTLA